MAKLTGQTGLTLAASDGDCGVTQNVFIDYSAKTIKLRKHGSLDDGGVTLQALYSFIMTQWKDQGFELYKFPIYSITPGEYELQLGWDFADDTTRYLLRDAGWNLLNATTRAIEEVWIGFRMLGTVVSPGSDQVYFIHTADGTPTNFQLPGVANQAVKIYGDATHGNFDYRLTSNSRFVVFLREQGKTYASYDLNTLQDETELRNILYSAPLSNATDLDIEASDAYIDYSDSEATGVDFNTDKSISATDLDFTGLSVGDRIVVTGSSSNNGTYTIAVYTDAQNIEVEENLTEELGATGVTVTSIHASMSITWGAIQRDLGEGNKDFGILIDANGGTLQEIYEFCQRQLRNPGDIDDGGGTEIGRITDALVEFVGPTLKTKLVDGDKGVFIDNFRDADKNDIRFVDDLGAENKYPFVSVGRLNFNENLVLDAGVAKYWMIFADAGGNLYDTPQAIIVHDNDDVDISGTVSGSGYVDFTFDYENNEQGGRTKDTDAVVIIVAIGANNAKYVSITETLSKSTTMSFTLPAEKERNYVA